MKSFAPLAVAAALCTAAAESQATVTAYDAQSAFLAAVSAPAVDGFEALSTVATTSGPWSGQAGAYGYTATAANGFFGAGSAADPALSTNVATDTVTFANFSGGASAIGGLFFGSDISGILAAGTLVLVATDATGATLSRSLTGIDTASFMGFVATAPITSLTLTAMQPAGGVLWPTVDNLTLAVPEPSSWLLLVVGLAAVAMARRRPCQNTCENTK